MKRILLAFAFAPLVWPFVASPAMDIAFTLYTGIDHIWSMYNLRDNPHYFVVAYLLMLLIFAPLCLVLLRLRINRWWIFVIGGAVLGAILPIPFFGIAPHVLSGTTLGTAAMMAAFWFIGVRNNSLYVKQPNSALNPGAPNNGAPVR